MIAAAVVLCPPAPDRAGFADADRVASLVSAAAAPALAVRIPPDDPDEPDRARAAHWVGRTAMAVAGSDLPSPVLLVAHGEAARLLPALGFAQRAARRPVGGYLIVDGVLPQAGQAGDWPDGPIRYLQTSDADDEAREAALQARLRGWDVVVLPGPPGAELLAEAIVDALDPTSAR